ncbi:MAG: TolC family protein [Deltaproteobacteria bacterium]|nr:TolC family protein [Deltaproteobacteria bacterium]
MNKQNDLIQHPTGKYANVGFSLIRMAACILAGLLLSSPMLGAEDKITDQPGPAVRIVTLNEALAVAADRNKNIKKALEYKNYVMGRYIEERAAALPQFSLTGKVARSRDETQKVLYEGIPPQQQVYNGQINVSQVIFTWGQIGAAIRAAEIGMKTADDQIDRFRQAVAKDVSTAFYDVLLTKELMATARQTLDLKSLHLEEARRKYAAGTATDYDVLAAEVSVKNARPNVINTENAVQIARERLAILLGGEGRRYDVDGSLEVQIAPLPEYRQAVLTALKRRPELAEVRHRLGMQEELITVAKGGDKPRLDLQAYYGRQNLEMGSNQGDGELAAGGIFLTFPFFDGLRTNGKVAQAFSEFKTLTIEEARFKDDISLQVFEAHNDLKSSGAIVSALSGTVAQAEKLLDMANKGFTYGVKTNLDVQDAQLHLEEARAQLAKARRDYLVAGVALKWVTGTIELPSPKAFESAAQDKEG